jgi:hypothetical protein
MRKSASFFYLFHFCGEVLIAANAFCIVHSLLGGSVIQEGALLNVTFFRFLFTLGTN